MIKNILATVGLVFVCVSAANAAVSYVTLKSIVQRADGLHFGLDYGNGQQTILSAEQARTEIQRICPRIHIDAGVLGN